MSTVYVLLTVYTICLFMAGFTCHAMFTAGRAEDAERWRALIDREVGAGVEADNEYPSLDTFIRLTDNEGTIHTYRIGEDTGLDITGWEGTE